jgi:hypothetical protein
VSEEAWAWVYFLGKWLALYIAGLWGTMILTYWLFGNPEGKWRTDRCNWSSHDCEHCDWCQVGAWWREGYGVCLAFWPVMLLVSFIILPPKLVINARNVLPHVKSLIPFLPRREAGEAKRLLPLTPAPPKSMPDYLGKD